MYLKFYLPLTLSQVQTVLAFILSILSIGWIFFLSAIIRYYTLRRIKRSDSVPVMEAVLPLNLVDVYNILRSKRTKLTVTICLLVLCGLALTNFDGIIVVNTIGFVETCRTAVVKTSAQITTENFQVAVASYAETDAILQKRNKSGVPSGVLVGQLPKDSRWKFDSSFDVDPYPWRSSCSVYASGETNVNLNTSILSDLTYKNGSLEQFLPEVHSQYGFRNGSDGYNFNGNSFKSYVHFNRSNGDTNSTATGSLILMIERFIRGNVSEVGAGVIDRLWTLRVPEENRMPYNRNNLSQSEIVSVPIVVKAYACEVTRVKEGSQGGVNVLGDISVALSTSGDLVGRQYLVAQIKGTDDTILEYTPEYWASYIEVRDTMVAKDSEVSARIYLPCFTVDIIYIILVGTYFILFLVGTAFWLRFKMDDINVPGSVVSWAVLACGDEFDSINTAEFKYINKNTTE
ncbi:3206_t:CDS:1 [Acaulospora morrowiae]|uniref:3206_t:CDS:1 n=1 Tax=Acaulospora morrowiae TaxID=94023 RepID=A0A9N9D251_9GLOM|nr:3206_t:CDS:1 [Acaulospora morrowiae]